MVLGHRIKQFRQELGVSQTDFAGNAGIPIDTLRKYESDKRAPGSEALLSMCRAGANINWLLTGEGPILLRNISVGTGSTNAELLTTIIDSIEQVLDDHDLEMTPRKKAEVIVGVYELLQDSDTKVSPATILRLVKSAA